MASLLGILLRLMVVLGGGAVLLLVSGKDF